MIKDLVKACLLVCALVFTSCAKDKQVRDNNAIALETPVDFISEEMAKVRDYVPKFAVVAHRGTTFWAPEETEAAFRWARDMGADYLEADLQCSKDGVILALHDDNLRRTTDIEIVFGETVPSTREQYYKDRGYSEAEAKELVEKDKANFNPYYANQYMYEELMQLDAGAWFDNDNLNRSRDGFKKSQYISTLEDLIQIAQGKKLKRQTSSTSSGTPGATGVNTSATTATSKSTNKKQDRVYKIESYDKSTGKAKYKFEYDTDDKCKGHRPGIYLEFKESWLNPKTFEKDVYDELDRLGFNIITKPATETEFYKDGKVNVGNTNGKVILQTFSLESLKRTADVFQGKLPMCFLFWKGKGATDLKDDSPAGYASYINLAIKNKAHIIGPSIAGAPNNYPELNEPWQAYLIKKAGLLNHPYSFDTMDQMKKYFGEYNFGNDLGELNGPYFDATFTNRTELTLQYMIDKGVRDPKAGTKVEDPDKLLTEIGY